jgi:hypothetical protein
MPNQDDDEPPELPNDFDEDEEIIEENKQIDS